MDIMDPNIAGFDNILQIAFANVFIQHILQASRIHTMHSGGKHELIECELCLQENSTGCLSLLPDSSQNRETQLLFISSNLLFTDLSTFTFPLHFYFKLVLFFFGTGTGVSHLRRPCFGAHF